MRFGRMDPPQIPPPIFFLRDLRRFLVRESRERLSSQDLTLLYSISTYSFIFVHSILSTKNQCDISARAKSVPSRDLFMFRDQPAPTNYIIGIGAPALQAVAWPSPRLDESFLPARIILCGQTTTGWARELMRSDKFAKRNHFEEKVYQSD